jgi:uncharacterized protein RhaS with RHS repeats
MRARYYNPAVGRFQTADPYEGSIQYPLTLHKYVYAVNNPVNFVDPSGKDIAENAVIRFSTHGLDHLIAEGLEFTQSEVEAYIEQLVRELLAEIEANPKTVFDVPFLMSQLGNVPWAARVFIVSNALIQISTYFPINKP